MKVLVDNSVLNHAVEQMGAWVDTGPVMWGGENGIFVDTGQIVRGVSEALCIRLSPCGLDGSFIEPFWV